MFICSSALLNKGAYFRASKDKKSFDLRRNLSKDTFISASTDNISFEKSSSSIVWPTINKANLRITYEQYTELLKILEEGIELIKNKEYRKAIEHFSDENNAKKTGIKLILLKDEYKNPPLNVEETQLLYQSTAFCAVDQHKYPLELHLGVVLINNEPVSKEQKKFLNILYHAQAYVCLHEWLHVLQNTFKGLLSKSLTGIKVDHLNQSNIVDAEASEYYKSLNNITNMMVIESDTWKFLVEQGIPIPKSVLAKDNIAEYNHRYFFDQTKDVKFTNVANIKFNRDLYINNSNVTKAIKNMEIGSKVTIGRHADINIYKDQSWGILDKHIELEKLPNGKYRISYCNNGSDSLLKPDVSFKDSKNHFVFFGGNLDLPIGMSYDAESGSKVELGKKCCNFYLP